MTRTGQSSLRLDLSDPGMVLVATEQARQVARVAGLAPAGIEDAAVVAAELAANAVRHATGGHIVLLPVTGLAALDVVVSDRGPGRADFAACFSDGFSTMAGSLGAGLGAVARRAAAVDVCSEPGRGTVVAARIGEFRRPAYAAAVGSPKRGETINGDAWGWADIPGGLLVVVADGLGHGPAAGAASGAALEALDASVGLTPQGVIEAVHQRLRHTRGAAVTVARVLLPSGGRDGEVTVAGVGNVAAAVVDARGSVKRFVIGHGTAGLSMRTAVQTSRPFALGDHLVLHSDGLTGTWDLVGRSALLAAAPLVRAAALLREFERGTDDTAVVVVSAAPHSGAAGGDA